MAAPNTFHDPDHPADLSAVEARQGRPGRPIVWVMVISIALVTLGFAALWAVHAPTFVQPGGGTQTSGQGYNATVQQPRQTQGSPESVPYTQKQP